MATTQGSADAVTDVGGGRSRSRSAAELGPGYKWIALSNTTLGVLMVTINQSIVLIALPNIFDGIKLNPLQASNTSYLLWLMMGFMVVTAVLVVSFGRLGDMFGRVRMYNLGFAAFSVCSILLSVCWMHGTAAALWLIGWRVAQGIGGALLFANSTAILTDVFPANKRGTALGINAIAAIAGSFIGLILGGVLGPVNWHYVFLVSVPFGAFGTFWAYIKLHDTGIRRRAKMDWWGNITFGVGLIAVLVGITYGIQPYGGHTMGWGNPWVIAAMGGGIVVLIVFVIIENRVAEPLFRLSLFRIRAFTAGNLASLLTALGRGGLQFMLIIWLQGIWLPQHGFSFKQTPLWAGIYMIPLTIGFLVSAPLSGVLSDRFGPKLFTIGGALITAGSFGLLLVIPVNFSYWAFAVILIVCGLGSGLFASPNRAEIMNSVPADQRGVGAGMTATFQNSSMVLSIGIFFSLMVAGLSGSLPSAMQSGLVRQGVPLAAAAGVSHLPPIAVLFAAFLGYNPMQQLLGPVLHQLPASHAQYLTGRSFFPHLITQPFSDGLTVAFAFAIIACVVAAIASALTGRPRANTHETVGGELAEAVGMPGEASAPGAPHAAVAAIAHKPATEPRSVGGVPISGRVYGIDNGPVTGAAVTLISVEGRQLGRSIAQGDGSFAIDVPGRGSYVLIASAEGYQPQASSIVIADTPVSHDILLIGGRSSLAGSVRSADSGAPITGAIVVVTDLRGDVLATATTDEKGEFTVIDLVQGPVTVAIGSPRYRPSAQTVEIAGVGTTRIEVELRPGAHVRGTVRAGEAPLSDARVTLVDNAGNVIATITTGTDGRYAFSDLDAGTYTVIATGYPPKASELTVSGGGVDDHDIELAHSEDQEPRG